MHLQRILCGGNARDGAFIKQGNITFDRYQFLLRKQFKSQTKNIFWRTTELENNLGEREDSNV